MKHHVLLTFYLGLIGSLIASCNKTAATGTTGVLQTSNSNLEEVVPKQITATPSVLNISEGENQRMAVTGVYPYGLSGPIKTNLFWSSDDTSIFTVNAEGVVAGVKAGQSLLRVEKLGVSTLVEVNVAPARVNQIVIFPENPKIALKLHLGNVVPAALNVEAYGLMTDGAIVTLDKERLTWSTDDETGLTWTQADGHIARKAGKWTLKASYGILEAMKRVEVTEVPLAVESIAALVSPVVLRYGDTGTLSLKMTMNNASTTTSCSTLTAEAVEPSKVTILSPLQFKAIGSGKTEIKVSCGGKSLKVPVYIKEAEVTSITLEPENILLNIGSSQKFTATANFSDGRALDITTAMSVTSSNSAILTASGPVVTGHAMGAANLTVSYQGVNKTILVNVGAVILSRLEVRPTSFTLAAGRSANFTIHGIYTDGTEIDLSTNSDVVKSVLLPTVGEVIPFVAGAPGTPNQVRSKTKGKTKVSVTYIDQITNKNLSGSATLDVLDPVLESISFDPPGSSQPAGRYEDFKVKGLYSDNTEIEISSDSKITVDVTTPYTYAAKITRTLGGRIRATGINTGVADQKIKIIATMNGISGSTEFTAKRKILESVRIMRVNYTGNGGVVYKGGTAQFYLRGTYSDASTKNLTNSDGQSFVTWTPPPAPAALALDEGEWSLVVDPGNADQKLFTGISQGSGTIKVDVTDTDLPAPLSDTFGFGINIPCGNGATWDSYCLFLSQPGESCNQTCAAVNPARIYDPATKHRFGSGDDKAGGGTGNANQQRCNDVLVQKFGGAFTPALTFDDQATSTANVGCAVYTEFDINIGLQEHSNLTDAATAVPFFRRVCACE